MKTFAFYKTEIGRGKTQITVYRIIRNKPVFIGRTFYYNGNNYGAKGEALRYLINKKELPESYCDLKKSQIEIKIKIIEL